MKRNTEDLFKGEEVIHRKTNMALRPGRSGLWIGNLYTDISLSML